MSAQFCEFTYENFGIKADRLLLPIDLTKCPTEIFDLAGGFARPFAGQIVLLTVIAETGRETLEREAERHLRRISENLPATIEIVIRVCRGVPATMILTEAAGWGSDLILLPVFTPSFWEQLRGGDHGATARQVIAGATTRVFVVDVRKRVNCWRCGLPDQRSNSYTA